MFQDHYYLLNNKKTKRQLGKTAKEKIYYGKQNQQRK